MTKTIKDPIYSFIQIDELSQQIIDTPEFQRLRYIKQLSVCHFVYPSATHTRFSHSIGVYNLAGKLMHILKNNQPELHITDRLILLVKIAGLCHDIGHVTFSHAFDERIIPYLKIHIPHHEIRSIQLFKYIIKKYNISITSDEIWFITSLINPSPVGPEADQGQGSTCLALGVGLYWPPYLYEIISNSVNSIDVDKIDYLLRDSYHINIPCGFDYKYVLNNAKVIDNHISFHEKVAYTIYSLFNFRYRMHREVYQHITTLKIEHMMADVILKANHVICLEEYFKEDSVEWIKLTDTLLYKIENYENQEEVKESLELLNRIYTRNLYKIVPHTKKNGDFIKVCRHLGFTNKDTNPIDNVKFYDNNDPNHSYSLSKNDISHVLPRKTFEKEIIYIKRC